MPQYLGRAMASTARLRADASGEATQPLTVAAPQPGAGRSTLLGDRWLLVITAAVTLPILWLGYGTDLDIEAVRDAGRPHPRPRLRPVAQPGRPGGRGHRCRPRPDRRPRAREPRHGDGARGHGPRHRPAGHGMGPRQRRPRGAGVPGVPDRADLGHPDGRLRLGGGVLLLGCAGARPRPPDRGGGAAGAVVRQPQLDAAADRRAVGGRRLGPGRAAPRRHRGDGGRAPRRAAVRAGVAVVRPPVRLPRRHRRLGRPVEQRRPVPAQELRRGRPRAGAAGGVGAAGPGAVAAPVGRGTHGALRRPGAGRHRAAVPPHAVEARAPRAVPARPRAVDRRQRPQPAAVPVAVGRARWCSTVW